MTRRSSLVIAGSAALAIVLAVGIRLRSDNSGERRPASSKETELVRKSGERKPEPPPARQAVGGLPDPQLAPDPPGSEAYESWVETRTRHLLDLAWNDDRESMLAILAELRNPDPGIRSVAADATREFGSRDAIPVLRAMVAAGATPDERKECLDLVEWLELPTLSEHLAAERERKLAADPAE